MVILSDTLVDVIRIIVIVALVVRIAFLHDVVPLRLWVKRAGLGIIAVSLTGILLAPFEMIRIFIVGIYIGLLVLVIGMRFDKDGH